MTSPVLVEIGTPKVVTTSVVVARGPGHLLGIFVSSGSGPLRIWDSTVPNGALLVDTLNFPRAGWWPLRMAFLNGLYFDVTGLLTCTAVVNQ